MSKGARRPRAMKGVGLLAMCLGLMCLLALPAVAGDLETDWQEQGTQDGMVGVAFAVLELPEGGYLGYYMAGASGMTALRSDDGVTWTREEDFIPPQPPDTGQPLMISNPWVFRTSDGRYRMIFEMQTDQDRRLYSGISDDGLHFTYEGMVMSGGDEDRSAEQDGQAASSARTSDQGMGGGIFLSVPTGFRQADGSLRMYFVSRGDSIATALSYDDGLTWEREPGYCLENAVDPTVVVLPGGGVRMFYTDWDMAYRVKRIGYADSSDGVSFTPQAWIVSFADPLNAGSMVDPEVLNQHPGPDSQCVLFLSYGNGAEDPAYHRLVSPAQWSWELYPQLRPASGS